MTVSCSDMQNDKKADRISGGLVVHSTPIAGAARHRLCGGALDVGQGPSGQRGLVTLPPPDMKEAATETKGTNAKAPQSDRARMSGMQWHRLSRGNAAGATGA
jgi:hypothetical protein